jgi:hypothetical protein
MKLTVIVTREGRVAGAAAMQPVRETRVGYPSARLVPGPGQRLVELVVAEDILPPAKADPEQIARFLTELETRIQRGRPRAVRRKRGPAKMRQ